MSLTLDDVERFLRSRRLAFRREPGRIVVGFETARYRDELGRSGVAVVVMIDDEGGCLELLAPDIGNSRRCGHPAALFQVLLDIAMRTRMIRFEHDPDDGEVRCSIECPIEDGTLTARQFHRMLGCLAEAVDLWHPVIRRAMDTGSTQLDLPDAQPARPAAPGLPAAAANAC